MQMIFPPELLVYCALATATYLLVVNWALAVYERRLVARGLWSVTGDTAEKATSFADHLWRFFAQWLLFAVLPLSLYSWLYLLLPLEGPRAGVAIALWTIVVGALPFAVSIRERHNIPFVAVVFLIFAQTVKLIGTLAIIGILFSL